MSGETLQVVYAVMLSNARLPLPPVVRAGADGLAHLWWTSAGIKKWDQVQRIYGLYPIYFEQGEMEK